jgi:hypothetical protein
LRIVVPAWSLALAFVAGLVIGVVACRLVMGRGRTTEVPALAAPTEPEPTAPSTSPEEAVPASAPASAAVEAPAAGPGGASDGATAEASAEASVEDPASAVDDVVAELERRVKGRRSEGEADRTTGGRSGRSE